MVKLNDSRETDGRNNGAVCMRERVCNVYVPYGSQKVKTILFMERRILPTAVRMDRTIPQSLSLRFTLSANWINEQMFSVMFACV